MSRHRMKVRKHKQSVEEAAPDKRFAWAKLPEELKAEIYSYLTPAELLNVARTNKDIHGSLRTRQRALDWQRARKNVQGLPPCPIWQSEMQFASLINDDCCLVCLKKDARSRVPIWQYHMRYCAHCELDNTTMENPFDGLPAGRYKKAFRAEDLLPTLRRVVVEGGIEVTRVVYHLPDVVRLREAIVNVGEMERQGVVRAQHALTRARVVHAEMCAEWQRKKDELEADRLANIEKMRYYEIEKRIDALGYSGEMINLGIRLEGLSAGLRDLVTKQAPLSDRDWRRMLPELKVTLEQIRVFENRQRDVQSMLRRLRHLDCALAGYMEFEPPRDDDVWPRALDLIDLPEAAFYIQLPHSVAVPSGTYHDIVPELVMKWRKHREAALLARLHVAQHDSCAVPSTDTVTTSSPMVTRGSSPSSPLSTPSALFWCTLCRQIVSGLQAMHHYCCYGLVEDWESIHPNCSPWLDGAYSRLVTEGIDMFERTSVVYNRGLMQWSPLVLRGCADMVRAMWASVGLSTYEQAQHARFACKCCSVVGKVMIVLDWRSAIHHIFSVHDGEEVDWTIASPQVSEKVKHVEYAARDATEGRTYALSRWFCNRCSWPHSRVTYGYLDLSAHCRTEHGAFPGEHYSLSEDSPESMHKPVVLCETNLPDPGILVLLGAVLTLQGDHLYAETRFPRNAWAGFLT